MRVQRTRSSPSALRSPLTRHPLGRRKTRFRLTTALAFSLFALNAGAADRRGCPIDNCEFPDTNGILVFAVGSSSQLVGDLTFTLQVADSEGECQKVQGILLKALSKSFPSWRYVSKGPADLAIIYQSGFSICLDDCEDRPLPQAAQAQLVLGRGEVQAHWSDESHWRARGRLVSLFTSALEKAIHGRPA
jgi:hypothetical protein